MAISDRLRQLLEERGWSTRRFQELVRDQAEAGTRGVSYASVWEYVEGTTEPPLAFVRVAAEVLGAREAWLATGNGPRTDDEAIEQHAARIAVGRTGELVLAEIRRAFASHPEDGAWLERDAFAQAALVHAWRRRCERAQPTADALSAGAPENAGEAAPEDGTLGPLPTRLAREIGTALRCFLDALNVESEGMSQDVRDDFVMGMVQAITATASEGGASSSGSSSTSRRRSNRGRTRGRG